MAEHQSVAAEPAAKKRARPRPVHGNYAGYYGRRVGDGRAAALPGWAFAGREVLDLGCNAGVLSLAVAARFGVARLVGVDLDRRLVEEARRNRDDWGAKKETAATREVAAGAGKEGETRRREKVEFEVGDALAERKEESFDTVMCMSLTKWVHLHGGDEAIVKLFEGIRRMLRPGGVLVLEAQGMDSYKKRNKKSITPEMRQRRDQLRLLPEHFERHLIDELGFKLEARVMPEAPTKGYAREILVFRK